MNLFIVDDEPVIENGLPSIIEKEDNEIKVVGTAPNGAEAISKISTLNVDLVLLDMKMPEMDGVECLRILKQQYPDLKVVAFTGNTVPRIFKEITDLGIDGIIEKTTDIPILINKLKRIYKYNIKIISTDLPRFYDYSEELEAPRLTRMETKVLSLLGQGYYRKEVADILNKSKDAIDAHVKNMHKKYKSGQLHEIIEKAKKARYI